MRALLAPDKFKGSFSAEEIVEAMAAAVGEDFDRCPIADGGDGTAATLRMVRGGDWVEAEAPDPLGRPVGCRYALLESGEAVIDVAEASGIWRLDPEELNPVDASSAGTGVLVADAIGRGVDRVLLACGGSATTDAGLPALARFDPTTVEVVCLCDVRTPFLAAAEEFGPQKGADAEQVAKLRERLARIASELPADPLRLPYTGAAGGLAGGFWAHGARLVAGAPFVLDELGFDGRLREADVVLTGEGRLDPGSLNGKAVGEVAKRARRHGVPCHAIVGSDALGREAGERAFESVREAATLEGITAAAGQITVWH